MKWIVESGGTAGANVFLLTVCKHAVSKMPSSGNITAQHHMTPTPSTQHHHTRTNWPLCFWQFNYVSSFVYMWVRVTFVEILSFFFLNDVRKWHCCQQMHLWFNLASVMWLFYTFKAADADGNGSSTGVNTWVFFFPPQTWQINHLYFLDWLMFSVFSCYILLTSFVIVTSLLV